MSTQPTGQTCVVSNSSGTVVNSDVTNIQVSCTTNSYALVIPTKLASTPLIGAPSYPIAVTDYGVGTISFIQSTSNGYDYSCYCNLYSIYNASTSSSFQVYPVVHLTPDVKSAWVEGWTGQGTTISIIDDFYNTAVTLNMSSNVVNRTATYEDTSTSYNYGKVSGTYDMVYAWSVPQSHGQLVSNIAGGDFDGQQLSVGFNGTVKSYLNTGCITLRASYSTYYSVKCDPDYYANYSSTRAFDLNYKKVAGIAKQANVVNNNVNLSSSQDPIKTVADIQGHLQNSAYLGVVNLSLGSDIPTTGKTFDQVMAEVAKFPLPNMDSVITVAAGNGGAPCATADLNGCNALAVALAYQAATASSTIVVGALTGSGSSENIAIYSTRAGVLAQRFVLASGEEGDANVVGTSFAAPRVAGIAAILKQKYPSLSSSQNASVILLSANKDINNDSFDDFSGVSPIYGHGKVSLARALALAAAI